MRAMILGGFAAGVLDLAAAMLQAGLRGIAPVRLLQAIASGLLGTASYEGGYATAALGLACHFAIAFGAAGVFVIVAQRMPFVVDRPWLSGPTFGVMVWAVMRFVVLPLSAYPHIQPMRPSAMAIAVLIHVTCVGLPIALAVRAVTSGRPGPHLATRQPHAHLARISH
jgi:hypothetical protein